MPNVEPADKYVDAVFSVNIGRENISLNGRNSFNVSAFPGFQVMLARNVASTRDASDAEAITS